MRIFELAGDGIAVYSGNDDLVLPMMALGARGVISVAANIVPRQMHAMVVSYLRGDTGACRGLQFALLPLIRALFAEVSPIPVKAAMQLMELCEGMLRLPLTEEAPQACLKRKEAARQEIPKQCSLQRQK